MLLSATYTGHVLKNITWLRGNMKCILGVEQDISRVSEANEWDILLSTINKFHISKHPCNILFISETFTKKNLNFYCKQSRQRKRYCKIISAHVKNIV